jgi:hypothetical protein
MISIYGYTVLLLDIGRFFSFLILYTVGMAPWTVDPQGRYPTQKINAQRYQPTSPAFERAKKVHALDGAATVIGKEII